MAAARPCPVCRTPALPRPENVFGPFCSQRCKLIDLGAWLSDEYRIPGDPVEGDPDREAPAHDRQDDDD